MKAKVIKTGEVLEVYQTSTGWASDNLNSIRFFNESDLDFDYLKWEVFRREAAKDAMNGMLSAPQFWQNVWSHNPVDGKCNYPRQIALFAIACADELIKQLKEEK